ncbi:MAG TPA: MFS transporter, partial [Gaiellaceae bacterium]|nr:MFS transporter [Gaiellaceae bacterium]
MTARSLGGRTFASLRRHHNYRLYFLGQVVSISGTWMQNIAMYWLVLSLTHSALAIAVLSIARFGPFTLFALF